MTTTTDGGSVTQWQIRPTKYIFSVLNGSTPSSSEQSYWDGDIYWATPEDIGSLQGKILTDTKRKITHEGYLNSGTQIAPINSIILTTRAPVGNLALAGVPLCTNQGCKILVPISGDVDTRYMYYQLLARKHDLNIMATGTTFQELGSSELKAFELLLPPRPEQCAIADYLDRATAKIDTMIATKQRLLNLLAEKRRAMISQAVTHGINSSVQLADMGIPWVESIPSHWQVKLGRYLFNQSSLEVQSDDEIVTCFRDGEVTLRSNRRTEGFTNAVLELGYQGIKTGQLVLHSMDAFAGAIGVSDSEGKCTPEYIICDPATDEVFNPYYALLLREMALRGFIQASCPAVRERAPRVRFSDLKDMLLPLPPVTEQKEIVSFIREKLQAIDQLISLATATIELLRERRATLISEAVTGKLQIPTSSCN